MADFNVTCAISNLSISVGEKVKFIPLLPTNFKYGQPHLVGTQPYLIYPNCYYNPLCLPISGVYDECGSIYKIVKDENTKAIEKMFNMTIDDFMDAVTFGDTKGNKLLENVSGMFILDDIYNKLVDYNLKEVHCRFLGDLTEEIATILGFKKVSKKETKTYKKEGFSYDLQIGSYGAKLINKTDASKNIDSIYTVKSFVKYWEKVTNENLDTTLLEQENVFDVEYDSFRKGLTGSIKSIKAKLKSYEEISASLSGKNKEPIENIIKDFKKDLEYPELKRDHKFMSIFRDWDFFQDLYYESILNGELKNEFTNFKAFYLTMHSCNKFLFPAMNGEQFGNPKATKKLLELQKSLIEKSLEKVDKQIEKESNE